MYMQFAGQIALQIFIMKSLSEQSLFLYKIYLIACVYDDIIGSIIITVYCTFWIMEIVGNNSHTTQAVLRLYLPSKLDGNNVCSL